MNLQYTVEAEDAGRRLDVFLAAETERTRSQIKQLLDRGRITCNGRPVKGGFLVRAGDTVLCDIPETTEYRLVPEEIPLSIVYEDAVLAVVDKPQGMTVHPGAGNHSGTLANALLYHFGRALSNGGPSGIRPGIVHRLDKLTSGLLVVAKTDAAHLSLAGQIAHKQAERVYHAVCDGVFREDCGTVDRPIGRDPRDRKKMAVRTGGKPAVTHYRTLERYRAHSYMEFVLGTGRTHQIRVHCRALQHPVTGDPVYGYAQTRFALAGQLLHARFLSFDHPLSGERMRFEAPLPDYFADVLCKLRREAGMPT